MSAAEQDITAKLDELIVAIRASQIPSSDKWTDAAGIAAMTGYSARQISERIACRPDFPKPFRLDGHGHPRWKVAEVQHWFERQRDAA